MKTTIAHSTGIVVAATLGMLAVSLHGHAQEINWWTIDGGGALETTGGAFVLSGTIGQLDAAASLSGGGFALRPGFWVVTAAPAVCPGDLNCDGQVTFADINPFVDALLNGNFCDGTGANADLSGNGAVGFEDINPFVDLLTQNPLPIACP